MGWEAFPSRNEAEMRRRLPGYTGYSIGCAIVWAALLLAAARRGDRARFRTVRLVCAGWWLGWLSATIARAVYPR